MKSYITMNGVSFPSGYNEGYLTKCTLMKCAVGGVAMLVISG
jgi:hypothetical protein